MTSRDSRRGDTGRCRTSPFVRAPRRTSSQRVKARRLDDFLRETETLSRLSSSMTTVSCTSYFGGSTRETPLLTSFSAAKSFVSTLGSIAIDATDRKEDP